MLRFVLVAILILVSGASVAGEPRLLLFLLQGLPRLSPGPVTTAYQGREFLFPGQGLTIPFAGRAWVLRAFGSAAPMKGGGVLFTNYEVHLFGQDASELVFRLDHLSVGGPHIAWAGDLDRDDSIDLFAELTPHDCGHAYELFLSSAAPGRLAPAQVAVLATMCC